MPPNPRFIPEGSVMFETHDALSAQRHRSHIPRGSKEPLDAYLARLAEAGPEAIRERLHEIDNEWSIGRATKAAAGVLVLGSLAASATRSRLWALIPLAAGCCLTQYFFSRRSWLEHLFHHAGFRGRAEIEQERLALRALRGDFKCLPTVHDIEDPEAISRLEGEGGIATEPEETKLPAQLAAKEALEAARP